MVVLRSFGKAYGLAGLRLGFALASPDIVASLRAALGPWPVSGPAIAIGVRALADSDWLEATRARLGQGGSAARRSPAAAPAGESSAARASFDWPHTPTRAPSSSGCLRAGILTRPFANAPDWLRFGIPGDENAWRRLAAALRG